MIAVVVTVKDSIAARSCSFFEMKSKILIKKECLVNEV